MARKNFLRPFSALVVFGAVPIVAACGGHVISLGTSDTLKTIAADSIPSISGTPSACPTGMVHPNICCSGTGASATCGAWEANPLRACDSGDTTYPNPLSCCSLSDPKNCIDTPADAGPVPVPPPSYGCGYVCPPGWWEQAPSITPGGPESAACCTIVQGGITECVPQGGPVAVTTPVCGFGGGSSSSSGGSVSPPPIPVDAGTIADGSIPVIDAGPGPGAGGDDGGIVGDLDAGVTTTDDGGCYYNGGGYGGSSGSSSGGSTSGSSGSTTGSTSGSSSGSSGGCCYGGSSGSSGAGSSSSSGGYPIYDGGPASLCGACPPGWNAPSSSPELCCQSAPDGTTECFSQATGSAYGIGADDGGVSTPPSSGSGSTGSAPSSGWGGGSPNGPTCSGSDSSCSCDQTLNGHTYALDCYVGASGVPTCTCSVDGQSSGTASVTSCQDSGSVESAFTATGGCGFP